MRFVIMSLGSIGQRHLKNLRATFPDAVIAVWRRQDTPEINTPKEADCLCRSIDEVIAFRPDAAIIASPANLHLDAATSLALVGVHLLIEKPLSVSVDGIDRLIAICAERQTVLMVGYNLRFMPSLVRLRDLVKTGAIGDVLMARAEVGQYLPDWRPESDYRKGVTAQRALGGGVLLELSHEIDYILWTLGLPNRLTAVGRKLSKREWDVEDAVELLMEYDSPGRIVSIHLDMLQRSPTRTCRLVGAEGTLVWDAIADRIEHFKSESKSWEQIEVQKLPDKNNMYIDQLKSFVDCIESKKDPLCGAREGLQVLKIIEAARESIQTGRSINLNWTNAL